MELFLRWSCSFKLVSVTTFKQNLVIFCCKLKRTHSGTSLRIFVYSCRLTIFRVSRYVGHIFNFVQLYFGGSLLCLESYNWFSPFWISLPHRSFTAVLTNVYRTRNRCLIFRKLEHKKNLYLLYLFDWTHCRWAGRQLKKYFFILGPDHLHIYWKFWL